MMRTIRNLSLVIPVYNEAEGLSYLKNGLQQWMDSRPGIAFEVVLVNDGSSDTSLVQLREWALSDHRIRVISLSRNFGHQAAITAGLEHVTGEAVVVMDADLQHPLSAIDLMVAKYQEGYDVVYGVKQTRTGDGFIKRSTAWAFYRLQKRLFHKDMPIDANDFRLMSRACLDALNALPEKSRFVRGLVAWIGFSQTSVCYEQDARRYGESKYPLSKMLSFSWVGITSFSILPIRFVTIMGFSSAAFSMLFLVYALYQYFMSNTVAGWTTIVFLQAFIGGCILLGVGIVGEYVGKIYEEVKGRPVYIKELEISLLQESREDWQQGQRNEPWQKRTAQDRRVQESA
jgi:dolichol-phosphate mannosyltransferase